MRQTWILDVLKDLETFAQENGLPQLKRQLSLTSQVARLELAAGPDGKVQKTAEIYGLDGRRVFSLVGERDRAG